MQQRRIRLDLSAIKSLQGRRVVDDAQIRLLRQCPHDILLLRSLDKSQHVIGVLSGRQSMTGPEREAQRSWHGIGRRGGR